MTSSMRKVIVLVIVAATFTSLSAFAIYLAGCPAREQCGQPLGDRMLRFELADEATLTDAIGASQDPATPCLRSILDTQNWVDYGFMASYSTLNFAIFLLLFFLAKQNDSPRVWRWLPASGCGLAVVMLVADVIENHQLLALTGLALPPSAATAPVLQALLGTLSAATRVKWGALAAAALLAGLCSWQQRLPSSRWPAALLYAPAGLLLALGLSAANPVVVQSGVSVLAVAWIVTTVSAARFSSGSGSGGRAKPRTAYEDAYPERLREAERELLDLRNQHLPEPAYIRPPTSAGGRIGVALSGGGIRSATFCLGFFQALARERLLDRVDYLSTVSGGGYFGSFLGRWYCRLDPKNRGMATTADLQAELANSASRTVGFLRQNGRYMSPNGAADSLLSGAIYLRNWVSVQFVMSAVVLFGFLALQVVRSALRPCCPPDVGAVIQSGLQAGRFQWSPLVIPVVLVLVLAVLPLGWGYWFTQRQLPPRRRVWFAPWITGFAVLVASALLEESARHPRWGESLDDGTWRLGAGGVLASLVALGAWLVARRLAARRDVGGHQDELLRAAAERSSMSRWLSRSLWTFALLAAVALIDSVGQSLDSYLRSELGSLKGLFTAIGASGVALAAKKAVGLLGDRRVAKLHPSLPLIAGCAGIALVALWLTALDTATHALAWGLGPNGTRWAFLAVGALTVALGWTLSFLNLSSYQALYGARLTRAFLGASNPARASGEGQDVTEPIAGDDLPWGDYAPHARGGPLHLVNVTFNETIDGRSQTEERDRKGLAMAIGPAGISVSVGHHALWVPPIATEPGVTRVEPIHFDQNRFHILAGSDAGPHQVEGLGLGTWTSISGAAASTGMGAHTTLGLSLLLGFFNVRLGYWWNSGISPRQRRARVGENALASIAMALSNLLPVQTHLLDELLARFHGPARLRWNLSDGGHFENMACYELIRRRVPWIIALDNGGDPDYGFEDMANLVRKARIDFGAEIEILSRAEATKVLGQDVRSIGSRDEVRGEAGGDSTGAHATLARVTYHDPEAISLILFVKPSLTGDEPLDVQQYQATHRSFPQETTGDQFFDEAQWESYRRLGEHVGAGLFAGKTGRGLFDQFAAVAEQVPT